MKTKAFVAALSLASLALAATASSAEKAPKPSADACSLLKPTEIATLAGSATVAADKSSTDGLDSRLCQFTWGAGANVQGGKSYLNISVTENAKAFPGTDLATLKEGLLARAKAAKAPETGGALEGIGDVATWYSSAAIRMETTTIVKGHTVIVAYESKDGRNQKEKVAALLKAVVGRL